MAKAEMGPQVARPAADYQGYQLVVWTVANLLYPMLLEAVFQQKFLLEKHLQDVQKGEVHVLKYLATSTFLLSKNFSYLTDFLLSFLRVYGSGYPDVTGRGIEGRNFPFYFWPVTWTGVGGNGASVYMHTNEVCYTVNLLNLSALTMSLVW